MPFFTKARLKRWLLRMGLAVASFVVGLLVLEVVVRVAVPAPWLEQHREGIYRHGLMLVTGRNHGPGFEGTERLSVEKRPGEVRVFFFGESSVQGAPFEYAGSPPTMLYDQLVAALPDQDLTVVNMGRGASRLLDAYYYLLAFERYEPDIIVFYQGSNDHFTEFEPCLPVRRPWVYGTWRLLVSHSRLMWTARVLGPDFFFDSENRGPAEWNPEEVCDEVQGFAEWANILVDHSLSTGAQVVVATPVENPLAWASRHLDRGASPVYQALITCLLTEGCDVADVWSESSVAESWDRNRLEGRREMWRDAIHGRGVTLVDFYGFIQEECEQGLRPMIFAEEVHLALEGSWTLAWMIAQEVAPMIDPNASVGPLPEFPVDAYRNALDQTRRSIECIYLGAATEHIRMDAPLLAALQMQLAMRQTGTDEASLRARAAARLLLNETRREHGLSPQLDDRMLPLLDDPTVMEAIRAHRYGRGCEALPVPL